MVSLLRKGLGAVNADLPVVKSCRAWSARISILEHRAWKPESYEG